MISFMSRRAARYCKLAVRPQLKLATTALAATGTTYGRLQPDLDFKFTCGDFSGFGKYFTAERAGVQSATGRARGGELGRPGAAATGRDLGRLALLPGEFSPVSE